MAGSHGTAAAQGRPALEGPAAAPAPPLAAVADLLCQIRNLEAAIGGYCQLAEEAIISPAEALSSIEQALALLADARRRAEGVVRDGPAGEGGRGGGGDGRQLLR